MNSIEMTDIDGDALTLISRDNGTWITCTSGQDEVTVGPFPTRLVRGAFSQGTDATGVAATLIGRTAPAGPEAALTPNCRERAWAAFVRLAETAALREALDGALDAALTEAPQPRRGEQPRASSELAEALRHAALDDADALADHLASLGYRKA